jgi:hypothetical protein
MESNGTGSHPVQTTSTTSTTSTLPALWIAGRDQLQARRRARAERKQLRNDLATYTSKADLDDLYATLDRYDDNETALVRTILGQHQTLNLHQTHAA